MAKVSARASAAESALVKAQAKGFALELGTEYLWAEMLVVERAQA